MRNLAGRSKDGRKLFKVDKCRYEDETHEFLTSEGCK